MDKIKDIVDDVYSFIFYIFEGRKIDKRFGKRYFKQFKETVEKVIPKEYAAELIKKKNVSELIDWYRYVRSDISGTILVLTRDQGALGLILKEKDPTKKKKLVEEYFSNNPALKKRLLNAKDLDAAIKNEILMLEKLISELESKLNNLRVIEKDVVKLLKKKERLYKYRERKVGLYYKIIAVYLLVLFVATIVYYYGKQAYNWLKDLKRDIDTFVKQNEEEEIEL